MRTGYFIIDNNGKIVCCLYAGNRILQGVQYSETLHYIAQNSCRIRGELLEPHFFRTLKKNSNTRRVCLSSSQMESVIIAVTSSSVVCLKMESVIIAVMSSSVVCVKIESVIIAVTSSE